MKIQFGHPPNYQDIIKHFPVEKNRSVVFTFADTIYVGKSSRGLSGDLMKHEEHHIQQQKELAEALGVELEDGAKEWWRRYFDDKDFRLDQEAKAYGIQYAHMLTSLNRAGRRLGLKRIAGDLSGPIYGHLCNGKEAEDLIQSHVAE